MGQEQYVKAAGAVFAISPPLSLSPLLPFLILSDLTPADAGTLHMGQPVVLTATLPGEEHGYLIPKTA